MPYVPPHPALSNPSKVHRYVFTLAKQRGPLKIDVKDDVLERGRLLPMATFLAQHELEWKGFGFVTSVWNKDTPLVFKHLGIHEPVYGKSDLTRKTLEAKPQLIRQPITFVHPKPEPRLRYQYH